LVFFGARVASIVDASRPFADLRLLLLPPPSRALSRRASGFESLRKRYGEITTPLLVLHGAEDEATDPGASEIFVREAGSTDKTFASLPNAGHLIAHERATRDVVTRAIVDFVVSRAAAAAATTTPGASEREEDARGSAGASRRGGGGGGEERESVAPAVVAASRL
jgi:acylglycerol lipase